MAAEVRNRALDRDLWVPLRHGGEGSDGEFGHVGADLVGVFEVDFPVESGGVVGISEFIFFMFRMGCDCDGKLVGTGEKEGGESYPKE